MKERNVSYALFIGFLVLMVLLISIPPAKAQIVLAEWEYDNGYGEGIEVIYITENSTGAWVSIYDAPAYTLYNDQRPLELNTTENTSIRIWPYVNLNHTLRGLSENASAFNIMRVGVVVSMGSNASYFSQQNLTWSGGVYDDTPSTWSFGCWAILPFHIVSGNVYIITLTYEVYEVV